MVTNPFERIIEVYSTENPWINCVFLVDQSDEEKAKEILKNAYDEYWSPDICEPYGDFFGRKLKDAGIKYEIFYAKPQEEE